MSLLSNQYIAPTALIIILIMAGMAVFFNVAGYLIGGGLEERRIYGISLMLPHDDNVLNKFGRKGIFR